MTRYHTVYMVVIVLNHEDINLYCQYTVRRAVI